MAVSKLRQARLALLRVLGTAAVNRGGSYPRKGVITVPDEIRTGEVDGRLTMWAYPDGGVEIRVTELPDPQGARVKVHQHWIQIGRDTDLDHPKMAACEKVANVFGDQIGWAYHEDTCPALVWCKEWIAQVANAQRAARKAASKARRMARANQMTYMSTLTVPGVVGKERVTVVQLWRRFCKRDGVRFFHKVHGGWLAFPEPHPTHPDTFHLHVLHPNRINAVQIRAAWTRFLLRCGYELPAGTRCVRTHEKDWGSAARAADYAAKYLKKAFGFGYGRAMGQHRYLTSQGLVDGSVRIEREDLRCCIAVLEDGYWVGTVTGLSKEAEPDDFLWWSWAAYEPDRRVA